MLFAFAYLQETQSQKFYQRVYIVISNNFCHAVKKYWTKFGAIGTLTTSNKLEGIYALSHVLQGCSNKSKTVTKNILIDCFVN